MSTDAPTIADLDEVSVATPAPTLRFSQLTVSGEALLVMTTRPGATIFQLPRSFDNVQATSLTSALPVLAVTLTGCSLGPAMVAQPASAIEKPTGNKNNVFIASAY
ncbi:MAG: hypothetical protein LH491_04955 [Pseudoxanthomonas sp.]|nr:hypothetical protein [Pseudoxanthomonas sp.]